MCFSELVLPRDTSHLHLLLTNPEETKPSHPFPVSFSNAVVVVKALMRLTLMSLGLIDGSQN